MFMEKQIDCKNERKSRKEEGVVARDQLWGLANHAKTLKLF